MVDFRYHLVSLVSVFLALAVGIILGAGPLQNSIGDTLSSQVESLRESRDEAREELDATRGELDTSDKALAETGKQLVDGTLKGRKVALLVLPGASDEEVKSARDSLVLAGADITGSAKFTGGFANPDNAGHRKTLSGQVASQAGEAADANTDRVLASAVSYVLRRGTGDANSSAIVAGLTAQDRVMIEISDLRQPADAILVVAPKRLDLGDMSEKEASAAHKLYTTTFETVASKGPTVAAGAGGGDGTVIVSLRETKSGSTVDGIGGGQALVNTPIAIASEILGVHVHLGSGKGAEALIGTKVDVSVDAPSATQEAQG